MKDCKKSYRGECCCNCQHQIILLKHPWNNGELKGNMDEETGLYACNVLFTGVLEKSQKAILFDRKHGECEMYIRKKT